MSARLGRAAILSLLVLLLPCEAAAQRVVRLGVRGGAGIDRRGEWTQTGQIEIMDPDGSRAVQLTVGYLGAGIEEQYQIPDFQLIHDYQEDTRVEGVTVSTDLLLGHRTGALYLMAGLGLGVVRSEWRRESPSDDRLGTQLPEGGSFVEEKRTALASLFNLGLGHRLHEHLDVRAQLTTMVLPSSELHEDLKILPILTLTTGVAF